MRFIHMSLIIVRVGVRAFVGGPLSFFIGCEEEVFLFENSFKKK
jgi:hypothetical protein